MHWQRPHSYPVRARLPADEKGHGRGESAQIANVEKYFKLKPGTGLKDSSPENGPCYTHAMNAAKHSFFPLLFLTATAISRAASHDPAYSAMWKAVLDFENISVSRPQLLAEFQAVIKNYPDSEYQQRARRTVEILTRMIAEDEAHAKLAVTNLALLPVEDRVRECIFRLRDQNGHQWSQPGWCDILNDTRGTNTPAYQLVNVGYPAVPQLINALEDETFTRSVGYHRDFYFSHTVLTVGDCAVAVLQRIAGRSFYRPASTSGYMSNEHKNSETRKAVEAWWGEFQKKGEQQMLKEGTESGDGNAPAQAELLLNRYPDTALAALVKGTSAARDDWTRTRLVQLFEKFDSRDALAFLEQELHRGAAAPSVTAAAILNRKGRAEGIHIMIREWERSPSIGSDDTRGPNELVQFLASVDSPEAIAALGQNLESRALNTRMAIVETVGEGGSEWYGPRISHRSNATRDAIEKLLVTALQDTAQDMGRTGSRKGKNYTDPRVCDMAGFFLNQLWPGRYEFDLSVSPKVRDRQRRNCQNVWRLAHNLPALPLPLARTNHVTTNEAVKITAIEWDANTVKPSDTFTARVEAFRNKLLVAAYFTEFLALYVSKPEPNTGGLTFNARRDEDLTGVTLLVGLLPGTPSAPNQSCHVVESVVLGEKAIHSSSAAGDMSFYGTDRRAWEEFTKAIATAINALPETPFLISASIKSKGD